MKHCTEKIELNKLFWKNDNCSNLRVIFLLELNVVGCVWLCDISESQTPRFVSLLKSEKKRKGAPLLMEKKEVCPYIFYKSDIV